MLRPIKEVAFVLVVLVIVLGVALGCSNADSDTSDTIDSVTPQTTSTTTAAGSVAPEGSASAPSKTTGQDSSADAQPGGKVESLLSGETLTRYRALPEEYRVASGGLREVRRLG